MTVGPDPSAVLMLPGPPATVGGTALAHRRWAGLITDDAVVCSRGRAR
jgi:hypothetical protein